MRYYLGMAGVIVGALAIGYLFALWGEPRSHWFWCEVLRVC